MATARPPTRFFPRPPLRRSPAFSQLLVRSARSLAYWAAADVLMLLAYTRKFYRRRRNVRILRRSIGRSTFSLVAAAVDQA